MPSPYPTELRERAVRAYNRGERSILEVAEDFGVSRAALANWLARDRDEGTVAPRARGGGRAIAVDSKLLRVALAEIPDGTRDELAAKYNSLLPRRERVHASSVYRALRRLGYVFKKNDRSQPSKTGPM